MRTLLLLVCVAGALRADEAGDRCRRLAARTLLATRVVHELAADPEKREVIASGMFAALAAADAIPEAATADDARLLLDAVAALLAAWDERADLLAERAAVCRACERLAAASGVAPLDWSIRSLRFSIQEKQAGGAATADEVEGWRTSIGNARAAARDRNDAALAADVRKAVHALLGLRLWAEPVALAGVSGDALRKAVERRCALLRSLLAAEPEAAGFTALRARIGQALQATATAKKGAALAAWELSRVAAALAASGDAGKREAAAWRPLFDARLLPLELRVGAASFRPEAATWPAQLKRDLSNGLAFEKTPAASVTVEADFELPDPADLGWPRYHVVAGHVYLLLVRARGGNVRVAARWTEAGGAARLTLPASVPREFAVVSGVAGGATHLVAQKPWTRRRVARAVGDAYSETTSALLKELTKSDFKYLKTKTDRDTRIAAIPAGETALKTESVQMLIPLLTNELRGIGVPPDRAFGRELPPWVRVALGWPADEAFVCADGGSGAPLVLRPVYRVMP